MKRLINLFLEVSEKLPKTKSGTLIAQISKSSLLAIGIILIISKGIAKPEKASGYFTLEGKTQFFTGVLINLEPSGNLAQDIENFKKRLDVARENGEKIVRVHLEFGMSCDKKALNCPVSPTGEINRDWLKAWDAVIEEAKKRNLYVLPAFGAGIPWNTQNWDYHLFHLRLGGPCKRGTDLFIEKSACQKQWLSCLVKLVGFFQKHTNIIGWDIFSELDLIDGFKKEKKPQAIAFIKKAAEVIRENDPLQRPITVSLADINVWPELCQSPQIDFLQIHPYPSKTRGWDLACDIIKLAEEFQRCDKPVIIGESGLDWKGIVDENGVPTPDTCARAHIGYRQALWAALMSGYAAGNMYYLLDGNPLKMPEFYPSRKAVSKFAAETDFTDAQRIPPISKKRITFIGMESSKNIIGYIRDNHCVCTDESNTSYNQDYPSCPNNWPSSTISGEKIRIKSTLRGKLQITFYRPLDGKIIEETDIYVKDSTIEVNLPDFSEDIAFRITK